MKTIPLFVGILMLALATGGCNKSPASAGGRTDFSAQLVGSEQVPSVTTAAAGTATFWISAEGRELHYKLTVTDLNNVTMAHLHLGAFGKNGPPVVWLYPSTPAPKEINGASNGVLAEGTITAGDLAGPLEGKTMADLVAAIKAQNIYVNVHTRDHSDGEIRGQLR